MTDTFDYDEKLFRAVRPKDPYLKEDGSISSAAFKDTNGLSVDRDGGRTISESLLFIKSHLTGIIVWVTYQNCLAIKAIVRYLPIEGNEYHSEIHKDILCPRLTRSQAKYLSKCAVIAEETITYA